MKTTATIRGEIAKYLRNHQLTINQFARLSGVNSGTLSSILNGHRPMSMQQLDRITAFIAYEEGHFYDAYIEEYIFHTTPDWRRLGPFLQRCAELDKLECLDQAARMTMDNIAYAPMLFDMAERFYATGKNNAALLLYECVAESEKFQHSERLALCQYRLFLLKLGNDQEKNLQTALKFESFIDKLDEMLQLDAYSKLINIYLSLHRPEEVGKLSKRMGQLAKTLYLQSRHNSNSKEAPRQPIIFYILYSFLMQGFLHEDRGEYEKALQFTTLYESPDWIKNPSQEELLIINQFSEWAIANRYLYRLMAGYPGSLDVYVEFISSMDDEISHALSHIMLAANRYHFQVDHILERFKDYIEFRPQKNRIGPINEQYNLNRYTRFLAELGIYFINAKQHERGLDYIVESLEYSIRIRSDKGMLRCMGIFEQFRQHASAQTLERYQSLVKEVQTLSVYAWLPVV